jgi:pimeloyl-ACP methyl ester carboxylesterase
MERRSFLHSLAGPSPGTPLKGSFKEVAQAQSTANADAQLTRQGSRAGEFPANSTIVLVHGAWADGSCWRNVILPLERSGLHVICPPMPMTSLANDMAALSWALERTSGPVVLVGHAYSGAVIAAVGEDRVKSLVYISALAPQAGE